MVYLLTVTKDSILQSQGSQAQTMGLREHVIQTNPDLELGLGLGTTPLSELASQRTGQIANRMPITVLKGRCG